MLFRNRDQSQRFPPAETKASPVCRPKALLPMRDYSTRDGLPGDGGKKCPVNRMWQAGRKRRHNETFLYILKETRTKTMACNRLAIIREWIANNCRGPFSNSAKHNAVHIRRLKFAGKPLHIQKEKNRLKRHLLNIIKPKLKKELNFEGIQRRSICYSSELISHNHNRQWINRFYLRFSIKKTIRGFVQTRDKQIRNCFESRSYLMLFNYFRFRFSKVNAI